MLSQVQAIAAAPNDTRAQLNRIESALTALQKEGVIVQRTIDDILNETARQTTIEDSMEVLLKALKDQLAAQGLDQGKIDAAFSAISANNDRAAAAIVAGTPNATAPAAA